MQCCPSELVYHHNLVRLDPANPDTARRLRLGAMVTHHSALFIGGKLEVGWTRRIPLFLAVAAPGRGSFSMTSKISYRTAITATAP
jgi:hypothetical protein